MRMLSSLQKKKITAFAKKRAKQNDSFHDFSHLEEVAKNAEELAKKEKADSEVCWVAAMLHDICKSGKMDHGTAGAKDAAEFLSKLNLPKEFIEKTRDAIYFHNKAFQGGSIERRVLWDADKLTIIGPTGFSQRLLPYWIMKKGKKKGTKTAIDEYLFFEPLFRTKSGRKIVGKHTKLMHRFFHSLQEEASGDA